MSKLSNIFLFFLVLCHSVHQNSKKVGLSTGSEHSFKESMWSRKIDQVYLHVIISPTIKREARVKVSNGVGEYKVPLMSIRMIIGRG